MTYIEAKAAKIGHSGPGEISGAVETALPTEALTLFSNLFVQMQPKATESAEPTGDSAATSPVAKTVMDLNRVEADDVDFGAMDDGEVMNLTQLLVAAQRIVGTDDAVAKTSATSIDSTMFTDAPMDDTAAIATRLIQQAAQVLVERKQVVEGVEVSIPKTAYEGEALSKPQLTKLLQAAVKLNLKEIEKQVLASGDDLTLAQPLAGVVPNVLQGPTQASGQGPIPVPVQFATLVERPPQASNQCPIPVQLATLLQGPPQESGQGPIPVQLSTLVQGPPQESGQGPIPVQLATLVEGPPQASGQGPIPVQFATLVQGPPQASVQGLIAVQLGTLVEGPPQASGRGPIPVQLATLLQGPPQASGQGPIPVQLATLVQGPLPTHSLLASADAPFTLGGITGDGYAGNGNVFDDAVLAPTSKAESIGKTEGKFDTIFSQSSLNGRHNDRVLTPADAVIKLANRSATEAMMMAQKITVAGQTVSPPMMLDRSRQNDTEKSLESNNQSQPSTTSGTSVAHQQGGHSGGNSAGQQGRDTQPMVESGVRNAGGERVAVYRLNVQQNGWADTMVRRLKTNLQNGMGAVKIILEPRNLGRLQVTMGLRDGRASIRIAADTAHAAGLLRDSRAQLAQMFEQSGLRLANMQTTTAIINGDENATVESGGSQMFADQQTTGQNANKDGKNSEHRNKLLSDSVHASDIEIDTTTAMGLGETAVLNVLA